MTDIEIGRYALRTFRIDYKHRELRSLTQHPRIGSSEWKNGTCEARCRYSKHAAPHKYCSCGIYGTNTLEGLRQFGLYPHELVTVFAAEGDTIIGDTGLRTANARVVAYWARARGARKICKQSLPDAKCFTTIDDMLTAYRLPYGGPQHRWGMPAFRVFLMIMMWIYFALFIWDGIAACRYTIHHDWWMVALDLGASLLMGWCAAINFYRLRRGT